MTTIYATLAPILRQEFDMTEDTAIDIYEVSQWLDQIIVEVNNISITLDNLIARYPVREKVNG